MLELIDFPGTNCWLGCVLTLANNLGIDYVNAFWNFFSETDFLYIPIDREYVSKRLFVNLARQGCAVQTAYIEDSGARMTETGTLRRVDAIEALPPKSFAIIDMDAYFIPWSPSYRLFSTPHCFIADVTRAREFRCWDVTHKLSGVKIAAENVKNLTRAVYTVEAIPAAGLIRDDAAELSAARESANLVRELLLENIGQCQSGTRRDWEKLERLAAALLSNRRGYGEYLSRCAPKLSGALRGSGLFGEEHFARWESLRHGLLKAAITKGLGGVTEQLKAAVGDIYALERG